MYRRGPLDNDLSTCLYVFIKHYKIATFCYILNETSKPPVNTTQFFNIADLLLNCLT